MLYFLMIITLWGIYLAFTANFAWNNLLMGLFISLGITFLLRGRTFRGFAWRDLPGMVLALFMYIGLMVWDLVKSGFQVAGMVLNPKLELRSGIIAIPACCESQNAIALSAHAITITPGELVLEIDGDTMYTHCLDATDKTEVVEQAQALRRGLLQRIIH